MKYTLVAVGGTFDRFHKGHESLLKTAFDSGKHVIIGLTTEEMVKGKMLSPIIDSYENRRKAVEKFLVENNYQNRYELVPLVDPYGPVKRRPDIEAVVVGPRFSKEVVDVLKKRIDIIRCPVVKVDSGPYLSSTSIRLGHVNRVGATYKLPGRKLYLSESARSFLKKPLGTLYKKLPTNFKKPLLLITAGDEATRAFISNSIVPDLSIVDFYVQRQKKYSSIAEIGLPEGQKTTKARNGAGMLTPALSRAVKRSIKRILSTGKKETIQVVGEEDLAPLLCILFAPLTTLVCYGQPPFRQGFGGQANEGIVLVEVTEKKKEEIAKLLESFTPAPRSATMK